ncbi:hypothetical protein U8Y98_01585 [Priestia megaterium]|uniref:hypothetical protein n=1 Tax=Priestia megaterium TaxID=1404 RepID=UPI002FE01699
MKEIETIKSKIVELEAKNEELSAELEELSKAIESSVEDLLLGKVDEKTIDKAKEFYEAKTAELKKNEEYIQRAKAVRKKLAVEKFVPFAKENRKKRTKQVQDKYEEQAEVVLQAKKAFLQELAKLGQIKREVGSVNSEYNQTLKDMGEQPSVYGVAINEKPVFSPEGWTHEQDCLGVQELVQQRVYAGIVPQWAADDSK